MEKYGESSHYCIQFVDRSSTNICRRKFKAEDVYSKRMTSTTVEYVFCIQCDSHLKDMSNIEKEYTKYEHCWPGFFWSFLQNTTLQSLYDINIFNLIPTNFCYWWIDSLLDYFPDVYQGMYILSLLLQCSVISQQI
jgi:hypothetical protein